ncbi:hypothetical protein SAMN05421659_104159 [[Clostridium] fimetarium]|uniref:Uncharacterized protein n=1 Tax=[Clostridium] fimetarium TaxID=99656 RepID=A0A1I0P5F9_9FIRM|nr:hypothetical protein SAMN05421659_104159 [[Clostridium] fimetarium]
MINMYRYFFVIFLLLQFILTAQILTFLVVYGICVIYEIRFLSIQK